MTKKHSSPLVGICALAMAMLSTGGAVNRAFADDAETQGKNTVEDAKTTASKTARKGKKNVRKAAGTDTVGKDAQDKANDTKNDAENSVNKAKNKIDQ